MLPRGCLHQRAGSAALIQSTSACGLGLAGAARLSGSSTLEKPARRVGCPPGASFSSPNPCEAGGSRREGCSCRAAGMVCVCECVWCLLPFTRASGQLGGCPPCPLITLSPRTCCKHSLGPCPTMSFCFLAVAMLGGAQGRVVGSEGKRACRTPPLWLSGPRPAVTGGHLGLR